MFSMADQLCRFDTAANDDATPFSGKRFGI